VLQVARPDDDEVAGGVGGDGGTRLSARRVRVDAELGAEGDAGAGVALAENAKAGAVLRVALADDKEVGRGVGEERRRRMVIRGGFRRRSRGGRKRRTRGPPGGSTRRPRSCRRNRGRRTEKFDCPS